MRARLSIFFGGDGRLFKSLNRFDGVVRGRLRALSWKAGRVAIRRLGDGTPRGRDGR